jgi:WD40 repeat protein/serine/threonine protein kinase
MELRASLALCAYRCAEAFLKIFGGFGREASFVVMDERKTQIGRGVNTIEEAIFHTASELQDAQARAAFLEQACGADPALRARIESLLDADVRAKQFTAEDPLGLGSEQDPGSTQGTSLLQEASSEVIGRYKLFERIGEGGMGVVYLAEQAEPVRRRVALKIIKLGMDTKQVIARFEAERQALALMDHPNIARVLDAGATEPGRPYFVMELVQGVPITEFCDKNQLSTEQRLKLFIPVCQAIQSAHQKGIIHRDLKPSNILVALNPDGSGFAKVIDFGIAKAISQKLTEKTLFTAHGMMVGTPAYMSPEQAELSHLDVDTRTDIYSLGALLYELLTGTTPFPEKRLRSAGYHEMQRIILEEEPERPSTRLSTLQGEQRSVVARNRGASALTLDRVFRGDLDWIVMKCLEKDRARRYETANGLARDLQRHLENEPVVARPPSTVYRLQKFVRRNKLAVAAAAAVAATLLLGIGAALWEVAQTKRAEQKAQQLLYANRMRLAQAEWEQNRVHRVRQILEQTASYPRRGFEWYYWQQQTHSELLTLRGHLDQVWGAVFSPDGQRIVTGSKDKTAVVWDATTGTPLLTLTGHLAIIHSVAFSPDGQKIVTSSGDGQAKVWNAVTGQELLPIRTQGGQVWSAAFSPDGQRIVTGDSRSAKVWDAASGQQSFNLEGHTGRVSCATFSPDGKWIATASEDQTAIIWEATSGKKLVTFGGHNQRIFCVAFSPDSRWIVTASEDHTAKVWDAGSGHELLTLRGHDYAVRRAAFSPDGRRIVTASDDFTAKVWDAESGKELFTIRGHENRLGSAAFSPDGRLIITGSDDNTAKIWDADRGNNALTLRGHDGAIDPGDLAFSPDGKWVATGSMDQTAKVWEAATGKLLQTLRGHSRPVRGVAFSPNGRRLVTASGDQTARVWDWASSNLLFTLSGHDAAVIGVAWSPDGRWLATSSADQTARIWEAAGGKCFRTLTGHTALVYTVAFSADSSRIATGGGHGTAIIWDTNGTELFRLAGHTGEIWGVSFAPDGKRVATVSLDGTARVWEATRGTELVRFASRSAWVYHVSFSPDSRRIVTSDHDDRTASVWDADNGEELLVLKGHDSFVGSVTFSPDGQRIATSGDDCTAKIWKAASASQVALWQKEEREAAERLAARQDELDRAEKALPGAIRQWLVLGPFGYRDRSGAEALAQEEVPHETDLRPLAGERVRVEVWVRVGEAEPIWRPVTLNGFQLDIAELVGATPHHTVAYALCYIVSETRQTNLCLKVGSDDACLVCLNGKQVFRWEEGSAHSPDQDPVSGVELNAGVNVLFFKLVFQQQNVFRGSIRLTDSAGQPVKGIQVTLAPP